MSRRYAVAAGLTLVLLAVIGLLYLQALGQGRAARPGWLVTHDLSAGSVLTADNVRQVRVPATGDGFALQESNPLARRLTHRVSAQTLLTPDDLMDREMAEVPLTVRTAPALSSGDTVNVYALTGGHAVLVGRRLVIVATGNPLTVLVPAVDEPNWIALQANSVQLYAAKGEGTGAPAGNGVGSQDAIQNLSGSARAGGPPAPSPSPGP
ncbi:MAG: hypothetical protein M3024_05275 [Candidatus Dormibacteraeota bacterium]|nr:hypothetical protein [Candidatus Dormibacteraeota bacterium]